MVDGHVGYGAKPHISRPAIVLVVFSALIFVWERITSPTQNEREVQKRLRESEWKDVTPEEW